MDDGIDPEEIVHKTADLLMAAGEVLRELEEREAEEGSVFDKGNIIERVQVAQVLALVASGEASKKMIEENRERLEKSNEESRKFIEESRGRLAKLRTEPLPRPEIVPIPVPPKIEARPMASPEIEQAMKEGLAQGPHPESDDDLLEPPKEHGQMRIGVQDYGTFWEVVTFTPERMIEKRCHSVEELAKELGHAAAMAQKIMIDRKK